MDIKTQVQKGQHVYTFGEYSVEVVSFFVNPVPAPFERVNKPLPVNKDKAGK